MKISSFGLARNVLGALLLVIATSPVSAQPRPLDDATPSHRFCATCHGTDGIGNESIRAPKLAGMQPWYLKRQLELFRSKDRGVHPDDIDGMEMQPMAQILTDTQIQDIVDWAATWPVIRALPTISDGDTNRGRELFSTCASCHGDSAQGNPAMNAPALQGQNDWYLVQQLKNFRMGIRGNSATDSLGTQMRSAVAVLDDEQDMIDVVSYINTLGL